MALDINKITEQYGFSEDEKKIMNDSGTANTAAMNQSRVVSEFILGKKIDSATDKLTKTIDKASESSDKLTKSIKVATWVAGIAAALGVVLGLTSLINEGQAGNLEVGQRVFDECFDYYANSSPDTGIDDT